MAPNVWMCPSLATDSAKQRFSKSISTIPAFFPSIGSNRDSKNHSKNFTLKKYNLDPKECVFIDDRLENIQGAVRCGINGIQFESHEKLINELKKINIEIKKIPITAQP